MNIEWLQESTDSTLLRVLVLHGLEGHTLLTKRLAKRLASHFCVGVCHYPAKGDDLNTHCESLIAELEKIPANTKIAFIGHSLGGIIALHTAKLLKALDHMWNERLIAVIQTGSPNNGSRLASILTKIAVTRKYFGPVLADLACRPKMALSAPPCAIVLGVGFGRLGWLPFLLHGSNDGVVSDSECVLAEHREIIRVFCPHFLLPVHTKVADFSHSFLMKQLTDSGHNAMSRGFQYDC